MADGLDVSGLNQLAIEVGTLPARGLAAARSRSRRRPRTSKPTPRASSPSTPATSAPRSPGPCPGWSRRSAPPRRTAPLWSSGPVPAGPGGVHGPGVRPPRRWPRAGPSADRRRLVAGVSRRVIAAAIEARLREDAPMVNVYVGFRPGHPTRRPGRPGPRVRRPLPRPRHVDAGPVGAHRRRAPMDGQVTCVGGDVNRCLACADAVADALTGHTFEIPGVLTGYLRELGDPGPAREDRDARPSRWFLPLTYQLHATRRVTGA
jgi:hypothetical protein